MIDYPGRRESGHVRDMRLEDHGFDARYPLEEEMPGVPYAAAYAEALIKRSGVEPRRVAGVVGYCMAGHLAQEAAAQLSAGSGTPVPLVLFDSAPCTAEAVAEECRTAFGVFGTAWTGAVLEDGAGRSLLAADALRNAPERTIEAAREVLRDLATEMLAEDVADEEELAESAALSWTTTPTGSSTSSRPTTAPRPRGAATRCTSSPATTLPRSLARRRRHGHPGRRPRAR
ncbi:hypothetical protein NKH77_55055 [Streptomyces sp. M19]